MRSVSMYSLQPKPLGLESKEAKKGVPSADLISQFGETLKKKLAEVNNLTNEADTMAIKMATGEADNLHDVIIAAEKANLAMQMTVQLKREFMKTYQQMMMSMQ
ncbi:MAG: flagellar hook-basal body complex protein FliE [bacterium]|nr:flagellar hook-basal body complex protein FliE [bacterium]